MEEHHVFTFPASAEYERGRYARQRIYLEPMRQYLYEIIMSRLVDMRRFAYWAYERPCEIGPPFDVKRRSDNNVLVEQLILAFQTLHSIILNQIFGILSSSYSGVYF